jgi:hypothetical protein
MNAGTVYPALSDPVLQQRADNSRAISRKAGSQFSGGF